MKNNQRQRTGKAGLCLLCHYNSLSKLGGWVVFFFFIQMAFVNFSLMWSIFPQQPSWCIILVNYVNGWSPDSPRHELLYWLLETYASGLIFVKRRCYNALCSFTDLFLCFDRTISMINTMNYYIGHVLLDDLFIVRKVE